MAALHCQKVSGGTAGGEGGLTAYLGGVPSFPVTWPILLWPGPSLVGVFKEKEVVFELSKRQNLGALKSTFYFRKIKQF